MSKIYSTAARALTKAFALCLLLVAGVVSAQAARTPLDYGALELDKAYALEGLTYDYVAGHYTATQDGVLTVTSSGTDNFTPLLRRGLHYCYQCQKRV